MSTVCTIALPCVMLGVTTEAENPPEVALTWLPRFTTKRSVPARDA